MQIAEWTEAFGLDPDTCRLPNQEAADCVGEMVWTNIAGGL